MFKKMASLFSAVCLTLLLSTTVFASEPISEGYDSDIYIGNLIERLTAEGIRIYKLSELLELESARSQNYDREHVDVQPASSIDWAFVNRITLQPRTAVVIDRNFTIHAGRYVNFDFIVTTPRTPGSPTIPPIGQVHVYISSVASSHLTDIWYHWLGPAGHTLYTATMPSFWFLRPIPTFLTSMIAIANYDNHYSITVNGFFESRMSR